MVWSQEQTENIMEKDQNNTGILFFNDRKTGKQPDRRGNITINGIEFEIAGWNVTTPNGKTFTRLTAKPKTAA